jgi:hypothetical protein
MSRQTSVVRSAMRSVLPITRQEGIGEEARRAGEREALGPVTLRASRKTSGRA